MITQGRLKALCGYDPNTGVFTWRSSASARGQEMVRVGQTAGSLHGGYIRLVLDGKRYFAHLLAWLYMTGEWRPRQIDHRDLDRANNRWSNLRRATHSQNMANKGTAKNNTSGLKGVTWHREGNKWRSQIEKDNKHISLGLYDCKAAAHFAFVIEAHRLYGEFARGA